MQFQTPDKDGIREIFMTDEERLRLVGSCGGVIARVAEHGFFMEDQFGTQWASHECQMEAQRIIADAKERIVANYGGAGVTLSHDYARREMRQTADI